MEGVSILIGSVLFMALVFVPGIAVTLALFPKWKEITFVERVGLSFILGMIPQLIIYFLNKNSGVEITPATSLGAIALVTAAGLVAYFSRKSAR